MKIADEPFFVTPYKDQPGGVDFLGLRQVNLDLMYQFLPGINNVTQYVRPYSVMCWVAWAFHQNMMQRGEDETTREEYVRFRERVELLFGWGHQLEGTSRGMVGSTSKSPGPAGGRAPLDFDAWGRNVSWLDAVNYGPSLKVDNGLGFLIQAKPGIFAATTKGVELAEVLDARLRDLDGYGVLRGQTATAPETVARSLKQGWDIEKPSARERKLFQNALFDETAIGSPNPLGHRSSAISLIRFVLERHKMPVSASQLRQSLGQGSTDKGKLLAIPAPLVTHHHLWVALQVRQVQRLAMEAFFSWIEKEVLFEGVRDSLALAKKAAVSFSESEFSDGSTTPGHVIAKLNRIAKSTKRLLWNGASEDSIDMFALSARLQQAIYGSDEGLCPLSVHLLLLVSAITDELKEAGVAKDVLDLGGAPRVSLSHWANYIDRQKEKIFPHFFLNFIETYMLSQHFGTATRRYQTGKQRLRLTIEENGLTPMISQNELWFPSPAPDRIETMLALLADCGMLELTEDGYTVAT